jgi:hypothetical protein
VAHQPSELFYHHPQKGKSRPGEERLFTVKYERRYTLAGGAADFYFILRCSELFLHLDDKLMI